MVRAQRGGDEDREVVGGSQYGITKMMDDPWMCSEREIIFTVCTIPFILQVYLHICKLMCTSPVLCVNVCPGNITHFISTLWQLRFLFYFAAFYNWISITKETNGANSVCLDWSGPSCVMVILRRAEWKAAFGTLLKFAAPHLVESQACLEWPRSGSRNAI